MAEIESVRTSCEDRLFILTIDHPPTNALDPQTLEALERAVDAFLADSDCRVAIIASANRAIFVSGADLPFFANQDSPEEIAGFVRRGQALFRKIAASPRPFIAAVNGLALGGGLELAMACHLRIVYEQARLGLPEIGYGIIPGWGGTQMLPRLVGHAKAAEMILTGESIPAQEALQCGLVNKIVPRADVLPAAKELGRKIAALNPLAVSAALASLRAAGNQDAGFAFETEQITALVNREDIRAGIKAKLGK